MTAEAVTACVHIDAPPERVYEYFTRPEAIVSWMGEYAPLEAEPGGRFSVDIKGVPVRGRFPELDPPCRLLISWGYAGSGHLPPGTSTVEIRLTADRGGTRVELQHRDLPPAQRPGADRCRPASRGAAAAGSGGSLRGRLFYPAGAGADGSFCPRPNSFPCGSRHVTNQPMPVLTGGLR
jgi:uncharacterized protein YndB with AHSA1/START domain